MTAYPEQGCWKEKHTKIERPKTQSEKKEREEKNAVDNPARRNACANRRRGETRESAAQRNAVRNGEELYGWQGDLNKAERTNGRQIRIDAGGGKGRKAAIGASGRLAEERPTK